MIQALHREPFERHRRIILLKTLGEIVCLSFSDVEASSSLHERVKLFTDRGDGIVRNLNENG